MEDLINEGLTGDELLAKFREKQVQFRDAIKHLIAESREVSDNSTSDKKTKQLFGDVMEN
ncbi:hypothetical protein [Paenibacillus alkalitolerans]|uniref:hypothetical protein n=1 Tax=Paenibacillus alkalitolerans TaxID=2799335 RepID=UPI0018F73A13|nr:hypothetical protein [Paenibacillus alkalitolerans]